ncbi:MAG: peptidoglycan-binding domain-containing protein [Candidatus Binatia bacterium]
MPLELNPESLLPKRKTRRRRDFSPYRSQRCTIRKVNFSFVGQIEKQSTKISRFQEKRFLTGLAYSLRSHRVQTLIFDENGEIMKHKRLFSIPGLAVAWMAFSAGSIWTQTTPTPGKSQTEMKGNEERTGEEKIETGGTQEAGRMERKKGEEEMEARGAQKPGRMGRSGAEGTGDKESLGERWTTQDIKKAQEALKHKGHDPGSIDGVIGPQTRQAIRTFQNASGVKETGRLDPETAEKLGVEKGTASGASSRQSTGMGKGQSPPTQKEPASPTRK